MIFNFEKECEVRFVIEICTEPFCVIGYEFCVWLQQTFFIVVTLQFPIFGLVLVSFLFMFLSVFSFFPEVCSLILSKPENSIPSTDRATCVPSKIRISLSLIADKRNPSQLVGRKLPPNLHPSIIYLFG